MEMKKRNISTMNNTEHLLFDRLINGIVKSGSD